MKTLLFLLLAFTSLPASAYNPWACRHARERLHVAQANFQQAQAMVLNNASLCPGGWNTNAACMYAIANHYNQTVVELQRAERWARRACH